MMKVSIDVYTGPLDFNSLFIILMEFNSVTIVKSDVSFNILLSISLSGFLLKRPNVIWGEKRVFFSIIL